MSVKPIYKLVTRAEWEAVQAEGVYRGSHHDKRDGYIHFSTATQLAETARKYFCGVPDLLLLVVDVEALESSPSSCPSPLGEKGLPNSLSPRGEGWGEGVRLLRWEASRGGDLFPHLYADLPLIAVRSAVAIPLDADGTPIIPQKLAE
ncbi:MAG: DUF952 domain-containing protein [Rhodomicrobium sp.]